MSLSAADLAAFVDEDMPGYALATIGAGSVAGLFSNPSLEALGIAGSRPVFRALTTEVSSVVEGTAITINATAYTVAGIQPDGKGMTLLILERT